VTSATHIPVLTEEVARLWHAQPGDRLLDATLGLGGHARLFLERTAPTGTVVGLDADPQAIERAREALAPWGDRVEYHVTNFSHLHEVVSSRNFTHVLFDLGIGSHQLGDPARGFSFQSTAPLSMRYGQGGVPPSDLPGVQRVEQQLGYAPDVLELLQYLTADELTDLIRRYGEERYAHRIAAALKQKPLPGSAHELAERVKGAVSAGYEHGRIHPATRTFQALRLAVNRELEALQIALPSAFAVLGGGGILTVISFHSLEDRIVKQFMRQLAATCICPPEQAECTCDNPKATLLAKRPLRPSPEEVAVNPRARSAKLRALHKH
jgi:16S rRNA (cytosine1402-N4)-methyltransferase